MNFPISNRLELPILQELAATGGRDDVRFLYSRLVSYFPQLDAASIQNGRVERWRLHVQRAGKELDEQGLIKRERGIWTLTKQGRERVESEQTEFAIFQNEIAAQDEELTHQKVQLMLVEIGRVLGFYAQAEFEYYDVVWRETEKTPRLSHVFEVQHKGNIDSAFAKLKRAYDTQRSRPFLILASERDTNRAARSINPAQTGAFHELETVLTVLSFEQIRLLHRSLNSISDILPHFLGK
ncbi:MAG TPA: hypothetical protein VF644_19335 [Pyrinomonadaceae bacterium]|jgi:hypothetical protein